MAAINNSHHDELNIFSLTSNLSSYVTQSPLLPAKTFTRRKRDSNTQSDNKYVHYFQKILHPVNIHSNAVVPITIPTSLLLLDDMREAILTAVSDRVSLLRPEEPGLRMVLCPDRPSCNPAEQSGREKLPCKPSYQAFFKLTLQTVIAAARACGRRAGPSSILCVSLKKSGSLKSWEMHVGGQCAQLF